MKEHYLTLFQFEKWATGRVLEAMKQLPQSDEKCLEWMGHILAGQFVWYTRIMKTTTNYSLWGPKTYEECVKMFHEITLNWEKLFATLSDADFEKPVLYKTFKGEPYENKLKDILTHLINHGTYHRGQIIAKLTGQLPQLPATDFIVFLRMRDLGAT